MSQLFFCIFVDMKVYAPEYFDALLTLLRGELCSDLRGYEQWRSVFEMAALHAVSGIAADASESIKDLPLQIAVDLAPELEEIENGNAGVMEVSSKIVKYFEDAGLHPLIYKGVSLFKYYPNPMHRCPGDIDLWFPPSEFKEAAELLCKLQNDGEQSLTQESDGSLAATVDGIFIELHPRYFDCHRQDIVEPGSQQGELLMLSSHILKHILGNGAQLKHIYDYAMARKANGALSMAVSKEAGMKKWQKVLDAFVDYYLLGCGSELDAVKAQPLYERLKAYSRDIDEESKFKTALHLMASLSFALRYAPSFWLHTVTSLL